MDNPDLYDRDGDRWIWTECDSHGDPGYVWSRPHGYDVGGTAKTRQQLEDAHGPLTEAPSNQTAIKLPTIPDHVTALAPLDDPEAVYRRAGQNTWLDEQENTYSLGVVLELHPEGVVPVDVLSKYDEGLAFFRAHGVQKIYDSAIAERHAVNVIKHILNH